MTASSHRFFSLLSLAYPESDPSARAALSALMHLEACRQEIGAQAARNTPNLDTAYTATRHTLAMYDRTAEALDRAAPFPMDCAKGCDHCCRVQVVASVAEILWLAEWLRENLDDDALQALTERLGVMWSQIAAHTPHTRPPIPCPLLGPEGECSVYEARPLACRGWVSSDVRRCIQARDNPPGPIEADPRRLMLCEGLSHALRAGPERLGLNSHAVDLHGALWIALREPATALRWLAGQDPFASAAV